MADYKLITCKSCKYKSKYYLDDAVCIDIHEWDDEDYMIDSLTEDDCVRLGFDPLQIVKHLGMHFKGNVTKYTFAYKCGNCGNILRQWDEYEVLDAYVYSDDFLNEIRGIEEYDEMSIPEFAWKYRIKDNIFFLG